MTQSQPNQKNEQPTKPIIENKPEVAKTADATKVKPADAEKTGKA